MWLKELESESEKIFRKEQEMENIIFLKPRTVS